MNRKQRQSRLFLDTFEISFGAGNSFLYRKRSDDFGTIDSKINRESTLLFFSPSLSHSRCYSKFTVRLCINGATSDAFDDVPDASIVCIISGLLTSPI